MMFRSSTCRRAMRRALATATPTINFPTTVVKGTRHTFSTTPPTPPTNTEEDKEEKDHPPPKNYWQRLQSCSVLDDNSPTSPSLSHDVILQAGAAAFVGIGCLTGLHYGILQEDVTMVLGSFGATAVLVYGYPSAPFSQPRNVVLGHLLSASIGILAHSLITPLFSMGVLVAAPLSVSLSTMAMMKCKSVHPPAGGTCLIACIGSSGIHELGFMFLIPTFLGSTFLVGSAFLFNNLSKDIHSRKYPKNGWFR